MRIVALFVLFSCAHSPPAGSSCVTAGEVYIFGASPTWCAEAQALEDDIHEVFKELVAHDARFANSRSLMEGWMLDVGQNVTVIANGVPAGGWTDCPNRTMYVGRPPPREGSMAHEFAHAIQGCSPTQPFDLSGDAQTYFHSNWDPIYLAIQKTERR